MKRVVLGALAVAIALAPAALAGGKASTKVTLDHIEFTPGGTIYTGDIFSPLKACKNERRVLVYRAGTEDDVKIGSTLSYKGIAQPGYYWAYEDEDPPLAGDYYAKVRATEKCKGDRSALYEFTR